MTRPAIASSRPLALSRALSRPLALSRAPSRPRTTSHHHLATAALSAPASQCARTVEGIGGGCDYPVDILFKVVSRSLSSWSPLGYEFLRSFTINSIDQNSMLAERFFLGKSFREAACEWVQQNSDVWSAWVEPFMAAECPTGEGGAVCSGHGRCVTVEAPYPEGTCVCDGGYTGDACATPPPPE